MTCIKDCPICQGVGFYQDPNIEITDPMFGRAIKCPNLKYAVWNKAIGIPAEEATSLDWNSYIPTQAVQRMKPVLTELLERGYGMVYIHGQPGNGKTIMTKSGVAMADKKFEYKAYYARMSEMLSYLRSSFDEDGGNRLEAERLRFYKT